MNLTCLIIEDEPLAAARMEQYVAKIGYLSLLRTFHRSVEAIGFLKEASVDVLFLDIEMDELTGIELLKSLSNPPKVILTTAYESYALKGYELSIVDYLLKPFSFERFLQAVEKAHDQVKQARSQQLDSLFVKTEYRLEKVPFSEILYIEGMGDYRNVQTLTKKILTLQTFGELEARLPREKFCRVHKSYLVALEQIEFVERSRIKIREQRIPISETYKAIFFQRIGFAGRK